MIEELKRKYKNNGQFNLSKGQNVSEAARNNSVPDGYGIYLVFEGFDCSGELIYIGRAGTMKANGRMKKQGIRTRLRMKRKKLNGNQYFKKIMDEETKGTFVCLVHNLQHRT